MSDECVKGTQNAEKIIALEKRADTNDLQHQSFVAAINEIRDRLLNRPTPQMAALIAILSSACVGLLVKLASGQ